MKKMIWLLMALVLSISMVSCHASPLGEYGSYGGWNPFAYLGDNANVLGGGYQYYYYCYYDDYGQLNCHRFYYNPWRI